MLTGTRAALYGRRMMDEEIRDFVESRMVSKLYKGNEEPHDYKSCLAWDRLQPGWIKTSAREGVHIRLLFGAINNHGLPRELTNA
jgi:hypothetical protein